MQSRNEHRCITNMTRVVLAIDLYNYLFQAAVSSSPTADKIR